MMQRNRTRASDQPLSLSQEWMWLLERLFESAYNMPLALRLRGDKQPAAEAIRSVRGKQVRSATVERTNVSIAFLFPGQGAPLLHAGRDLYESEPVFRQEADQCCELMQRHHQRDLRPLLYGDSTLPEVSGDPLDATGVAPPALFITEYALARMWMAWGVQPDAMLGHSVGEYVAACLSGVFDLDDALRVICKWGRFADFAEISRSVELHPPAIPYISNVTGTWITEAEATSRDYWVRHLQAPVRVAAGMDELSHGAERVYLEVGPGQALSALARQRVGNCSGSLVLSSMPDGPDLRRRSESEHVMTTLGCLWVAGAEVDWTSFYRDESRHRVPLPGYPFERQQYWIEREPRDAPSQMEQYGAGIQSTEQRDLDRWFYLPSWRPTVPPMLDRSRLDRERSVIVFCDGDGLGEMLVRELRKIGVNTVSVHRGNKFMVRGEGAYVVNPTRPSDYEALLLDVTKEGVRPIAVFHFWNVATVDEDIPISERLEAAQDLGLRSLLALAKAMGRHLSVYDSRIIVVSSDMQSVNGSPLLGPEKATLLGPVRVIPKEYPGIFCQSIDVDLSQRCPQGNDLMAERLLAEWGSSVPEPIVAYRGNQRFVESFTPVILPRAPKKLPLKERGVYLITGGLGGVGLELAEHLAKTARARLILTGRSSFPERSTWSAWLDRNCGQDRVRSCIRRLQQIEACGGEVAVLRADVTDERQMRDVVAWGRERFGGINGVIHAAGIADGPIIECQTSTTIDRVVSPKVKGSLVLERVMREVTVDFMVLCSSLASITPRPGQVAYSAANAFLDALALHQVANGNRSLVAMNWDVWRDIGMSVPAADKATVSHSDTSHATHPLLGKRTSETADQIIHESCLHLESEWTLNEHQIGNKGILPGTAALELVRAALASWSPGETIEFRDISFLCALSVERACPRCVRTKLKKREDTYHFSIMSRPNAGDGPWREHVRGCAIRQSNGVAAVHDLDPLAKGCGEVVAAPSHESHSTLHLGPRWDNIHSIRRTHDRGLASLELPPQFADDLVTYALHPALLDTAIGFLAADAEPSEVYVPIGYGCVTCWHALPRKVFCYSKVGSYSPIQGADLRLDVTLMDGAGRELVIVKDAVIKKVRIANLHVVAESTLRTGDEMSPNAEFGMSALEATEVFDRTLACGLPRVIVSQKPFEGSDASSNSQISVSVEQDIGDEPSADLPHAAPGLRVSRPEGEVEKILAGIWQRTFGIDHVSVHQDFYELGGDSLLAMRLANEIEQAFGKPVPFVKVLTLPTIGRLAKFIAGRAPTDSA